MRLTRRSTERKPKSKRPIALMRPGPRTLPQRAQKLASPWFIFRPITSSTGKTKSQRGKTIRRVRSMFTAKASSPARSRCGNDVGTHIILRSSWIFSARGQNFVKTILRLAKTQSELRVVDDQIGGPTAADDVAKAILDIVAISTNPGFTNWGTYHFSGVPPVSWYEFARAIVADSGAVVLPVATNDYPRPARRPLNSLLDCSRILQVFGIRQPDWRAALGDVLEELTART